MQCEKWEEKNGKSLNDAVVVYNEVVKYHCGPDMMCCDDTVAGCCPTQFGDILLIRLNNCD